MPVKVRCPGCQKVLNAPDRARGKAVRCPECRGAVRIPAGKTSAGARPAATKRPAAAVAGPGDDEDFLAGVDLRRAADTRVRVCVKCGAEVDDEVVDCPSCGHNVETGVLSGEMRKKLSRKGPDPAEFWGKAWSDSWAFIKKNPKLGVRTGGYYALFFMLSAFCGYMSAWCERIPTSFFWGALSILFYLGGAGWFWFLSIHVIQHTLSNKRRKKMEKLNFDFFAALALGVKCVVWPAILMSPLLLASMLVVVPLMLTGTALGAIMGILAILGVYLFPLLCYPVAMVHMSMPYTYKAWIPYHMVVLFFKNIVPALYWLVMAVAVNLPFVIAAAVVVALGVDVFFFEGWMDGLSEMITGNKEGFLFHLVKLPLMLAGFGVLYTIVGFLLAFPHVFMMRANGLLGLYFRNRLELVTEQIPNVPCGFWVRYLAALVDFLMFPLTSILLGKEKVAMAIAWVLNVATFLLWYYLGYETAVMIVGPLWPLANLWLYFAFQEGSYGQATIGKVAMGIIVTDTKGRGLNLQKSTVRFFAKLVSVLPLGIGLILSAFTERKQGLHDIMANTLVVWQGDDERRGMP